MEPHQRKLAPVLVRVNVTSSTQGARIQLDARCPDDPAAAKTAGDVLAAKGLTTDIAHELNRKQALWGLAGLEGITLRDQFNRQGVQPVFELIVDGKRATKSLGETAAELFGTDEWVDLGELALHGPAHVTDPCYGGDIELALAAGPWRAQRREKTITWFGVGDRVWALRCWHPSFEMQRFETREGFESAGVAGVDSGQLGLIAAKRLQDARESPDYDRIFEYSTGRKREPYRDFGWIVSSGIGDGGYEVFVARNDKNEVIAVLVEFITDDDR